MAVKNRLTKRTYVLKIPVDIVDEESIFKAVDIFLQDGKNHHIMFITLRGLLRARHNKAFYNCLNTASLVLPVSKAIIGAAKFLNKQKLVRYNPYDFIIHLLSHAENNKYSVYLLGAEKIYLQQAERNLRSSYPKLMIIGRYSGYFHRHQESDVILAIKKSAPSLLLVGKGKYDREMWIFQNKKKFNPGISLYVDNCYEIFAGKEHYISKKVFNLGLESLSGFLKKPWKLLGIFPYIYFKLLLLIYKIFKL